MKIQDKKELIKLISYMAMGDGSLHIAGQGENALFAMNMRAENRDYLEFCKAILENVTSCSLTKRTWPQDGINRVPQLRLQSKTHPLLTSIRNRLYVGTYKCIDPHALKLLDAQALAFLYMCDGALDVTPPRSKQVAISSEYTVTLNMKRLSYGDQFILKKALKEKLDLEFNIKKQGNDYYLRLRSKDVDQFMELVAPYVTPSFQYKIKENFRVVDPLSEMKSGKGGEIVRAL